MSQKTKFLKELKDLLEKYDVTISFNLGESCDTHGFYGERITIDHSIKRGSWQTEEWLSVDGWTVGGYDIEITEDWEILDEDNWIPLFVDSFIKVLESEFQVYINSGDNEMNEFKPNYTVGVGIPNQWSGTPITDHSFTGIPPTTSLKSAYIPTVFIAPPELNVGETWYVKYPEDYEVTKVKILELTEKTVQFKVAEDGPAYPSRYKKSDVEFVEKVND